MTALNTADVLSRFALLTGMESAEKYEPLCADAAAEIEREKRSTCGPESSGPLACAAAALAGYRFALAQEGFSGGSFEAGDVKIAPSSRSTASARRLWSEAAAAASPYLADVSFLFQRTTP